MNDGESGARDRLASVMAARSVQLTTRGRKTGQSRTVTIWFVPAGPDTVYVQHAGRAPAHWYRNLVANSAVTLDFGEGPIEARAEPILDETRVREVLRMIRKKYRLAWFIQLLGWGGKPVAAEIHLGSSR